MPHCWNSHVAAHLSICYCLFQLLQVYQAKLNYLSWENLIEWITYVTSLLLVIDFEVCQRETGYRQVRPHLKRDGRKLASFILFCIFVMIVIKEIWMLKNILLPNIVRKREYDERKSCT